MFKPKPAVGDGGTGPGDAIAGLCKQMASKMKIYLVLHHEIMGPLDNLFADEMVFYTARSFEKAIELIKKSHVSRWSWWEIQVHELDSTEWPTSLGIFGPRGGKLLKSPHEKAIEVFKKEGRHT